MTVTSEEKSEKGKQTARIYFLTLMVFAVVFFLSGLGLRSLWGSDEPRVAAIAAEMSRSGEYLVPHLNGESFLEKPPLYFWFSSAVFSVFGESTYTAKLPSALAAVGGVLLIYLLARGMNCSPMTAFIAGIMLASSAEFWIIGRRCIMDMLLCFFICGVMWTFYLWVKESDKKNWLSGLGFILFLSGAVFCKGLVGLAIPSSALFFWLIFKKDWRLSSWIMLFVASALCFIPTAVWVWILYDRHGYEAAYEVVWTNNIGRFTGGHAEHVAPFYYYFIKFPAQFMPWTILVPFACFYHYRKLREKEKSGRTLFILCWLIVPLLLLSVSAGKRPIYILPLYPAAALFTAIATGRFIEKREWLAKKRWQNILTVTAIFLLVVFFVVELVMAKVGNPKKSYDEVYNYCRELEKNGKRILLYKPTERIRGASVFYLGHNVKTSRSEDDIYRELSKPDAVVLLRKVSLEDLKGVQIDKEFKVKGNKWVLISKEADK